MLCVDLKNVHINLLLHKFWHRSITNLEKYVTLREVPHTLKNAAHMEKRAKFGKTRHNWKMCHTWKKRSNLEKWVTLKTDEWVTLGKLQQILEKCVTLGKMRNT